VKTCRVGYFAGAESTGKILNTVGEGIPYAVVFFGGGIWRRLDGMTLFDERVEINHFNVGIEGFEDGSSGYARGEWGNRCENGSFRHFGDGTLIS
jgi:hypothetical protein